MDYMRLAASVITTLGITVVGFQAIDVFKVRDYYIATIGLSDRIVTSDEVKLGITIRNEADVIKDISEKRAKEREQLIEFLKTNGVQDSEIEDMNCDVEENHNYYGEKQTKKRYRINDNFVIKSVRIDDIKKLSSELSKLIDEGICLQINTEYLYKDMDKLRVEMIEEAAKDSVHRAERIAHVTGTKIQNIRNFSTGSFSISPADSSATSTDEWKSERSLKKRVRVVVHGSYSTN
ncbi:MAG: SIMPL domain-containing protein [Holosporales bacterium]|jgi:hypothetical protein|nr:SIMPL domain-containing protein [Holosporales bacterium]